MENQPAIFLDRDGVINTEPKDYVISINEFNFLDESLDALRLLSKLGFPIIIITNQSGIGRGLLSVEKLLEIHQFMIQNVQLAGGRIDAIYYCPHLPSDQCECRKPKPGLCYQASKEWGIDLTHSYLIGDTEKDLFMAKAAGCFPVFVQSGRSNHIPILSFPYHISKNLFDAANWIVDIFENP